MRNRKGMIQMGGEDLKGAEEGKHNQDILCEEKQLFSIKEKLILSDLLLLIPQF